MNQLTVGSDKCLSLDNLPRHFLLIDDAPPSFPRAREFDVSRHSFNPLRNLDHKKARELAGIIYAAFPQGENTLTVRNGKRELARLLLEFSRLDKLTGNRKDPFTAEALAIVDDVLFSPALRKVLCSPPNFSFKGTIVAKLDRATLGETDAYLLGNLLIAMYPGPVVLPDFGFYQAPFHTELLRQGRLIAGINAFDEVPKFKSRLLLVKDKRASRCTPQDAELLAVYEGLVPHTNEHNDFIQRAIS